jgi:hypothetical protein
MVSHEVEGVFGGDPLIDGRTFAIRRDAVQITESDKIDLNIPKRLTDENQPKRSDILNH